MSTMLVTFAGRVPTVVRPLHADLRESHFSRRTSKLDSFVEASPHRIVAVPLASLRADTLDGAAGGAGAGAGAGAARVVMNATLL